MKVLLVGSGGREHALADKLGRDAPAATLLAAPGNPGMEELATRIAVAPDDVTGLVEVARRERVDLVVVGPEAPLASGLVDRLGAAGIAAFGPTAEAARLESSKAFAKALMAEAGVPTADFLTFSDPEAALRHVRGTEPPLVVKTSGLAAGKGAIVCETSDEAVDAVESIMLERRFGVAGDEVVIEEFMRGREISVFFLCDGEGAAPLVTSRDYKRAEEGDRGLNTGGMGAYAPAEPSDPTFVDEVEQAVVLPVLRSMAARGTPYRGFLYVGLMLTERGPRVVEFNCRLGDPETQVVLPILSTGLLEPMLHIARGSGLGSWSAAPPTAHALVTVLASAGYPESSTSGKTIELPEFDPERVRVYHAGTRRENGRLVTAGGRVLGVVGLGSDLEQAARRSREAATRIRFDGARWRRDIGWHELHSRPT